MENYKKNQKITRHEQQEGHIRDKDMKQEISGEDRKILTGLFADRESTEKAYTYLREKGYGEDEINLIMSDETRNKYFSDKKVIKTEVGNKAAESAGKGSAIGGTLGAIAGVLAGIGTTVAIPGLGILVAGPIAAGLAGAGAGGLTGGLLGALVGSGIPETRAKLYESGVRDGKIVLGVRPRNEKDAEEIETTWRDNEGREIYR